MGKKTNTIAPEGSQTHIEEAFWHLLAQGPYSAITVKALAAEANISCNTFYYHFKSVDALAEELLSKTVFDDLAGDLLKLVDKSFQIERDEQLMERFERLVLLARSGSGMINDLLVRSFVKIWSLAGKGMYGLSGERERELSIFVVGGLLAIAADVEVQRDTAELVFSMRRYLDSIDDIREAVMGDVGE